MTDGLQKLFGSPARVKLLRLFLFNPRQSFVLADAAKRARVSEDEARKEINIYVSDGVVERAPRAKGVRYDVLRRSQSLERSQLRCWYK